MLKHLAAAEIYEAVKSDLLAFAEPSDDISLVVVKRTTYGEHTLANAASSSAAGSPE